MPTLTWEGPDGEQVDIRPDVTGPWFELKVPHSLRTGEAFKLVRVEGLEPEAKIRLMRNYR